MVRWTQVDGVTLHDGTPRYAQVEPRHDRHRHVDVRFERFRSVISAVLRVRRREDGRPRVEVRLDAGLRDGYCLLLHRFMDRDLVRRVHLVELVNTTNAVVRQHQSAGLDAEFSRFAVPCDARRQTGCGRGLARRVDTSTEKGMDILQELGLGRRRVTNDTDVDRISQLDALMCLFRDASYQL